MVTLTNQAPEFGIREKDLNGAYPMEQRILKTREARPPNFGGWPCTSAHVAARVHEAEEVGLADDSIERNRLDAAAWNRDANRNRSALEPRARSIENPMR